MNDICKEKIRTRLVDALEKESITTTAAAGLLGVTANVLSCIKNPKLWYNIGEAKWDDFQKWVNSGQGIIEYSEKHGKVLPERKEVKAVPVPVKKEAEKSIPLPEKKDSIPLSYYKEQVDRADIEIRRLQKENERLADLNDREFSEIKSVNIESQKVCIDIEVNLIINGKKIEIK